MGSAVGSILKTQTGRRRVWLVFMLLAAIIPIVQTLGLPIPVSPQTKAFRNEITKLPAGSIVVFGNTRGGPPIDVRDFFRALILDLASRNLKVIFLSFLAGGVSASEYMISYSKVESLYGWQYGRDYVIFPYLSGDESAMAAAAANFYSAYSTDIRGTPIGNIPIMQNVRSFMDVDLAIAEYGIFTFGDMYVRQWPVKYPNVPLIVIGQYYGIAAYYGKNVVGDVDYTPQARGEYEFLSGFPGEERAKTESNNMQAFLVMGMIFVGLISSAYKRHQKKDVKT